MTTSRNRKNVKFFTSWLWRSSLVRVEVNVPPKLKIQIINDAKVFNGFVVALFS